MRWTTRPEWAPILVAALAGALAVPFVPLLNALLARTLLFVPTPVFALTGLAMGALAGLATWRLMMAGFVQLDARGITLVRYERNLFLPWTDLDAIEVDKGKEGKATFVLRDGSRHEWGFVRTPRADFLRMRTRLADPVLVLPPEQREAAARELLEEHARDDLVLVILRVYAGLIGFMGVTLSCVL